MSDLGGRASNGGARTTGPVPVSGSSTPAGIRTPRDVMRDRNAREARRQEQQREEEQRRIEEKRRSEERRKSAERRAATVPGAAPRFSNTSSQYSPDVSALPGAFDGSSERRQSRVAGEVAGTNVLGEPTGRSSGDLGHRRGPSSVSQSDQPRPATVGATRRTQPSQPIPRQPAAQPRQSSAPPPGANLAATAGEPSQRNTTSSFPHAFERWETLSSHWEGLTSYWLHKLEQNTEEIRETVPNASTLNRQITDLSAAGANLFHAVVELQRLRASSERKFQRWFFETRADNERNREVQAGLERSLAEERKAREELSMARGVREEEVVAARKEVAEMRRELAISKDEARRAWEELGRRNQESLDLSQSLKEGRVTIVGGVQVVPWFGQTTSVSQGAGRSAAGYGGGQSERDDEAQYYAHQDAAAMHASAASPTNTDPFTEGGRQQHVPPPLHHEPGRTNLPSATPSANQFAAATTQATPASHRPATTASASGSSGSATGFYQQSHAPQIHSQQPPQVRAEEVRSEGSYVTSEGDTEYAIDPSGNIRRDSHGQPIVFNRRATGGGSDEEDFDTEGVEAPEVPGGAEDDEPDYEGSGYEGYQQYVPRHHHPTRLSDVLEEEEERSSRRTGD